MSTDPHLHHIIVPFEEPPLGPPPKLADAPAWAQALSDRQHASDIRQQTDRMRQQSDRHSLGNGLMALSGEVEAMSKKLGEEPDTNGNGGKGLIGDLRKTMGDVDELLGLKNMGKGALAAITTAGTLIICGLIYWIKQVAGGTAK